VLLIASLGWIFDVFEGQIFVASMNEAMPALLPEGTRPGTISFYNNIAFAAFLVGGALGGVVFGMLSDRIGRTRTMVVTILVYSCFTCVTAAAQTWWQMAILRFLVAMGVGGEWAVASAMVAEVFPERARAWSGAIFHGSSVLGTYLAVLAGVFVVGNQDLGPSAWRWGFAIGALPALLTLWIRWKLREPEKWVAAREAGKPQAGRLFELFAPQFIRHTLIGVSLAAIGLATFWGVHIYGKNLMRQDAERRLRSAEAVPDTAAPETLDALYKRHREPIKAAEMLGMFLTTTGGGIGLLAFGPLCESLGRRGAFLLFHIGGWAVAMLLFQGMPGASAGLLYFMLPVFGFLTLGMHAGYAVYFPELFPTRLRGSGGGFCFNVGRILAAPILFLSGWLQKDQALRLEGSAALLSSLFLVGAVLLLFAPETKGRRLPD